MHSYIKDFKIANIFHINILSICWGLLKKKQHYFIFHIKIFGIIKNVSIFAAYFVLYEHKKWLKKMRYKNSNIRKCLNTKTIALCAAFFLYCLLPLKGICQTGESTVDALVEMGFENVGWTEGRGIGKILLIESLWALKNLGYAYGIIGGVGPEEFYKKAVNATIIEGSDPGIYQHLIRRKTR